MAKNIVTEASVVARARAVSIRDHRLRAIGQAWSGIIDCLFWGQDRDQRYQNGSFECADFVYKDSPWRVKFFRNIVQHPEPDRDVAVTTRTIMLHPLEAVETDGSAYDATTKFTVSSGGMDVGAFSNAAEIAGYTHAEFAELILGGLAAAIVKPKDELT